MNGLKFAAILVALGLCGAAYSDEGSGSVTISSPTEGAKLSGNSTKLVTLMSVGMTRNVSQRNRIFRGTSTGVVTLTISIARYDA